MNALEAAQRIGTCFDDDGIPYAVRGALALGVWAVPRATKGVDISAFVIESDLPRVFDAPGDQRLAVLDDLQRRFLRS
jgi:hypothetical protein